MIISAPTDTTIDKQRIESMLMLMNHIMNRSGEPGDSAFVFEMVAKANMLPGLRGKFSWIPDTSEEIVFFADH